MYMFNPFNPRQAFIAQQYAQRVAAQQRYAQWVAAQQQYRERGPSPTPGYGTEQPSQQVYIPLDILSKAVCDAIAGGEGCTCWVVDLPDGGVACECVCWDGTVNRKRITDADIHRASTPALHKFGV